MSDDKKDRIKEDLERGLKYIDEARVDAWIEDFKLKKSFDPRPDKSENLWAWWSKNYPSTM